MWLLVPSVVLPSARPSSSLPGWFVPTVAPLLLPQPPPIRSFRGPSAHPPPPCVRSACPSSFPSCLPPPRSLLHSFRLSDSRSPVRGWLAACARLLVRRFARSFVRSFAACLSSPFGRSVVAGCIAARPPGRLFRPSCLLACPSPPPPVRSFSHSVRARAARVPPPPRSFVASLPSRARDAVRACVFPPALLAGLGCLPGCCRSAVRFAGWLAPPAGWFVTSVLLAWLACFSPGWFACYARPGRPLRLAPHPPVFLSTRASAPSPLPPPVRDCVASLVAFVLLPCFLPPLRAPCMCPAVRRACSWLPASPRVRVCSARSSAAPPCVRSAVHSFRLSCLLPLPRSFARSFVRASLIPPCVAAFLIIAVVMHVPRSLACLLVPARPAVLPASSPMCCLARCFPPSSSAPSARPSCLLPGRLVSDRPLLSGWLLAHPIGRFVACLFPAVHLPPPCVACLAVSCVLPVRPAVRVDPLPPSSPPFVHSFRLSDSRSPVRGCVRAFAFSSLRSLVRSFARSFAACGRLSSPFGLSVVAGCIAARPPGRLFRPSCFLYAYFYFEWCFACLAS